jgi:predicted AAA+ superfamily ATPase
MYSMDFEEYLWAVGLSDDVISSLREHFINRSKIDDAVHIKMMEYLREYMVVGGMPAVVSQFVATKNFGIVQQEQEKIIAAYLNDIAKYAESADRVKARSCFLSVPRQLAKDNTKFQYSVVEHNGTARKFGNSLDWLRDAGIVAYCYNLSTLQFPLSAYVRDDQFRIYLTDIGLRPPDGYLTLACRLPDRVVKKLLTGQCKLLLTLQCEKLLDIQSGLLILLSGICSSGGWKP